MSLCRGAALSLFLMLAPPTHAAIYYVDFVGGSDSNSGTSSNAAWKTILKVNGITFAPGDSILFKAGVSWTGSLNPKGSGTNGSPIVIDMYGTGAKPLINGNGVNGTGTTGGGAVFLYNQQYWEINNLEVINDSSSTTTAERRGIHLAAANFGVVNHLYVRNCYVHNIRGRFPTDNGDLIAKRTGGIVVEVTDDTSVATRFNDVLIENNVIMTVTNQGIVAAANRDWQSEYPGTTAWNSRKATNLIIRNNAISDVCKNAMIIRLADESCRVEYNVCHDTGTGDPGNTIFTASCQGTVFQYNEGYLNYSTVRDGSLYDADLRSPGIVFQYSYSHDNAHGLFWTYPSAEGPNSNVVVRYNISRADKGSIFAFSGDSSPYGTGTTYIVNNTVYVPSTNSPTFFDDRSGRHKYYVYNNIFYNLSTTATNDFSATISTRIFSNNVFYGQNTLGNSWPTGNNNITNNPMLVNPAGGGIGLNTLDGFKLQTNSPCIDSGINNPYSGSLDFWSNAVPYNVTIDRGANEYTPSNTPPTISCPGNITSNAAAGFCSAVVTFAVTGGGSPAPTITCSPPSGSTFAVGTNIVNCTASNGVLPNATCSFNVIVNDLQAPTITNCAPAQTNSANASCQAAVPNFAGAVSATDNCTASNALVITQSPTAGTLVGLGTTTVTITVKDAANNQATCQAGFTVTDTTPPTIFACAPPQTNSANGSCQTSVPDFTGGVVASDNCTASNALTITQSPLAGAAVGLGTTNITITVKDADNNQVTCQTSFTVYDTAPPLITCPADVTTTEDPVGSGSAAVAYAAPSASDNCAGVGAPSCSPPSGASFPIGTNTISCTVADAAGNTNSCTFLVIVVPASNSAFRIVSIQSGSSDVNLVWTTPGGRTNRVQATNGDASGGFSNNFTDISGLIIIGPYGDTATNYMDVGGATNKPSRYYRVRLVP